MSTLQRITALEEIARYTLRGPQSPTCLPNGGQSTTWPYVPPSLLMVPQRTGQSPSHHALWKSECRAKRVVAVIARMGRTRDPGDVRWTHQKSPFSADRLVWSHLVSSEGKLVCIY